ncbi:MAG: hypothetical protein ACI8T1_003286 [Verrucomicrobiales bacterium]|jgi:hypothetical protein
MGVIVSSIVFTIQSGITAHGRILAIIMYVFDFIESVIAMPFFYQQYVRLNEITHRLGATNGS